MSEPGPIARPALPAGAGGEVHLIELKQQNRLLSQQNALLAKIPTATGQRLGAVLNGAARTATLAGRVR